MFVSTYDQFLHNNGTKISASARRTSKSQLPKNRKLSSPDLTIILSLIVKDKYIYEYHNTVAASTLIKLFVKNLEFSKKKFKEENSVKENRETIGPNIIF